MDFKWIMGLIVLVWFGVGVVRGLVFDRVGIVMWDKGKIRFWGQGGNGLILKRLDPKQSRLVWMGMSGFDVFFKPQVVLLDDDLIRLGKKQRKKLKVVGWSKIKESQGFWGKWQVERIDKEGGLMRLGGWVIKWNWEGRCEGLRLVWESCEGSSGFKTMFLTEKWGVRFDE